MPKTYKSHLAGAIHETCEHLHAHGIIDHELMCEFDNSCLCELESFSAQEIIALREREGVSQIVFARHLNLEPHIVQAWEQGHKKPDGPALRLLTLIDLHGLDAIHKV